MHQLQLLTVLAHWLDKIAIAALRIEPVAGGLSGAKVWRVVLPTGSLCLRRWPSHCSLGERLREIHLLMEHVWRAGLELIPLPRENSRHETFIEFEGHVWELTSWIHGEASYLSEPNEVKRRSANASLARFHRAAAGFRHIDPRPAPGLLERAALLTELQAGGLDRISDRLGSEPESTIKLLAHSVLSELRRSLVPVLERVRRICEVPMNLQWCLGDIHQGNLLFIGDNVTGIVDFGAAKVDSVAVDIARLAGSLAGADRDIWTTCLQVYDEVCPLSPGEMAAIAVYDSAGLLATSANWLRWHFVENRVFADRPTVQLRLEELLPKLRAISN